MNEVNKIFSLIDGITQLHLDFNRKYGFIHFEKLLTEDLLKVIWVEMLCISAVATCISPISMLPIPHK